MREVQEKYPDAVIEVWGEDEHRVGLLPIVRRVWVPKGTRPIVKVQHRYQWMYLVGFVYPQKGETFWLIVPSVTLEVYEKCLEEFAQFYGVGEKKKIILVIDQAGYHREESIKVPDGIFLEHLPPYSPELQPAEKLWPLTNEGIANEHFPTIEALEEQQIRRCLTLRRQKEEIRKRCLFDWWPII